ncbi:tRNA pseudouridine(38-40) synthase TruA [Fonticella tunisiensis]|uniref:tRNA pseudouridine synthase A n=1 Tax=Fonticella tunisiensis TaxID=1096341 RepID=A0A4R7KBD8_9CLOT|nr:tRNA pseudouridine(38-40) synthase TruA [Fonticella tunisiensis]TDT50400.1 tRNA pseudouridine38-40 synthase [Fonticella tunisiensis]
MRNIKIVIEYDGTRYAGWQRQKNAMSIQEVVEDAISSLTKEDITIIGSSRTDAGVHARGQVANFFTDTKIPTEKLPQAINARLPEDITVILAEEVSDNFHARYCSRGKRYSYTILNRRAKPAYMRNYVMHCPYALDFEAMVKASRAFLGKHDFSAFRASGSSVKTSVRTVRQLELIKDGDIIKMFIEADGFLYNMVRIIAGTLVDIGRGRIAGSEIEEIILSKDRERAGQTAPASGLCLEKVYY